ncbi:MAG: chemotaxis protein CheA [Promethearchaeota archaeon]
MAPFSRKEMQEMIDMFLSEGKDSLQLIENQIQILEKDHNDNFALLELYRVIHSFKGMAGTVEFAEFEKFLHSYETLISLIQEKKVRISEPMIDLFFETVDLIEKSMKKVEKNQSVENDFVDILKKIESIKDTSKFTSEEAGTKTRMKELFAQSGLEEFSLESLIFNDPSLKFFLIKVILEDNIKLKLARLLVIIKNIEKFGIIAQTSPELGDILQGKIEQEIQILYQSSEDSDQITKRIKDSGEIKEVIIDETDAETIRKMKVEIDEEEQRTQTIQNFDNSSDISSVKVDLASLDKLIELYGELLIRTKQLENKLSEFNRPDINEILFQIQSYMFKFQDVVVQIQMVPISTVFRIFPRMVRNVAKQEMKEINFVVDNHNVKVDRKILNEVGTIVNHLLRNAINHGIETIKERKLLGKQPKGSIVIETKIKNNVLYIEINDDGRGIDPDFIAQSAIKKGLFTEEELNRMTDKEIINLIFLPKFSTAAKITNVSGRGIGMNIVKEKVEALSGSVSLETETSVGTTFTVILPISRLLIRAILVRSGSQIFSIALDDIERLYEISVTEIKMINSIPYIKIPGESNMIRIYYLGKLFKLDNIEDNQRTIKIVLVRRGDNMFGLIVEEFIRESEIVIKEIDDLRKGTKGISGAAILEDGSVSLIIDPFRIGV